MRGVCLKKTKKIAVVFGTRPEIIKLAELVRILKNKKGVKTILVYTGQHYDFNMYKVFMEELELPKPDKNLGVSGGSNAEQVSSMLERMTDFFSEEKVDIVVAQGDTNSVLAAALAAFYSKAKFAHVEAGLRSFDWRMPEETNRIIADKLAAFNFAPTKTAVENLKKSLCWGKTVLAGNTIVEAVQKNLKKASSSKILEDLEIEKEKYAVLTAHRKEYVDDKQNLEELVKTVSEIGIKVIFPVHPRTIKNLKEFGLWKKTKAIKNLKIVAPIGYFSFLKLTSESKFLLSDSGGIQEEASVYKKPVIVLRDNTERPEIIGKFGWMTGYNKKKILKESKRIMRDYSKLKARLARLKCPFGDGKASQKIARVLVKAK